MTQPRRRGSREAGFTLPEVLIVIAIMGILAAIAFPMWWGTIEARRVDSATNQVVADMRLAHSAATNRLGTARVIFRSDGGEVNCNAVTASYCLTRPKPDGTTQFTRRYLPPDDSPPADRVRITSPNLLPDPSGGTLPPGVVPGATSTVEFHADGSTSARGSLGTVSGVSDDCPASTPTGVPRLRVVADDGNPNHCITFNAVTSRVQID